MIGAKFIFPGFVKPFQFRRHGARIECSQNQNLLLIQIYRRVPRKLWEDLKYLNIGERYIIGYLASYMPHINRALIDNRYKQGHLLSRTFAIFEAMQVCVIVGSELIWINWPLSLMSFPPSAEKAANADKLFVRDLIDAMQSYFRAEFDECIRRLVTSIENLIEAKQWNFQTIPNSCLHRLLRLKPRRVRLSVRQALLHNLNTRNFSGEVLNENMQFIYSTRNKIVHSGLRLSTSSALFCSKAIATVKYIIAKHSGNREISRYVNTLHMQFEAQCSWLGRECNLDQIAKWRQQADDVPVINSMEAMNRFMFTALRFTQRDKQSILR